MGQGRAQYWVPHCSLFGLYLDDLLKNLRSAGLGCQVAGVWVGAAGYADDLLLLAPTRETMSKMLSFCEDYASEHNLMFSTDIDPKKSKSKCIYICGKKGNELPANLPDQLVLYGKNLPWVPSAVHLGHEIHQSGNMEHDCRIKRALFIDSSIEIRETFSFAHPNQVLSAVQKYSLHCYGAMLWNLSSTSAASFCKAWNTCTKLTYKVPRSTHTYIVENFLAAGFTPVMFQLYARYVKFAKSLKSSASSEVSHLYNIVKNNVQSTTGSNLYRIQSATGLRPSSVSAALLRSKPLLVPVPEEDQWRLPLLEKYLMVRSDLELQLENTDHIQLLIDGLCST